VKVHHLNCGTMNIPTAPLVCHVLLVETDNGLVLVDSGFGSHDRADPAGRVGPTRHFVRPLFDHSLAAAPRSSEGRLGPLLNQQPTATIPPNPAAHLGGPRLASLVGGCRIGTRCRR
jgi:hypothetical protein